MDIFSKRIKELRLAKGLTLKDMAASVGLTLMAYAHYEYGDRQPTVETIVKLCDFFGVSADYLLGRSDY